MDVVNSDPSHWKVPPFSAEILDGSIYGRGAQDMKNEGLAQFMVMVMLKREKVELDRDVIFLAVSDEEVDGTGSDWFIAHQPDLLENAEFLINEGGENLLENNGHVKYVGVDVGEKAAFCLHLVAHGRAGHGSLPIADSAPNRLVQALNRIVAYRTPLKVCRSWRNSCTRWHRTSLLCEPKVPQYPPGSGRQELSARGRTG
jgi:acetylornithine deacetylase/succinyl-diaminopimelate desuccinylase-like protein